MVGNSLLIYGATGYTGRLLADAAQARGLTPILCGRDAERLAAFAATLGLQYRVAELNASFEKILEGISVVINAAGPFVSSSGAVVEACLRAGAHYLDLSAELSAIETVERYGAEAASRGIMLMPAVGFDVVPSDCLALHMARQLPRPTHLRLGIAGLELMSRGSAKTLVEQAGRPTRIRRRGRVIDIAPGTLEHTFDYGSGPSPSIAVAWGDICTAFYSTGIPNIEVYFEATPGVRMMTTVNRTMGGLLATAPMRAWFEWHMGLVPEGPGEFERAQRSGIIVAEVEDASGRRKRARLRTPEAYTFTVMTAIAIAKRALRGDIERGFQTPARVYGPDFVLSFAGVAREDLDE